MNLERGAMLVINPFSALGIVEHARHQRHRGIVNVAAAGALGTMITRIARREGLAVIAVVRREEQFSEVLEAGADHVLVSIGADFVDLLREVAGERRATLLLDPVGGEMTGRLLDAAPYGSTVLVYGALSERHRVEFNVLTTVHAANARQARRVYTFLRDDVVARYIQFIPIVDRDDDTGYQQGDRITTRSVTGEDYGRFMIDVFDEWVRRDVGHVYVQMFDVALAAWSGQQPGLCIFQPTCGEALALEHDGGVYSCDHYVEPDHRLGNLRELPLADIAASPEQRALGAAKLETRPAYCLACDGRKVKHCHGRRGA